MEKQLLIIGMVVLLVCVGLSGCNETNNIINEEKLIGTWTISQTMGGQTATSGYTFYTNKTVELISSYGDEEHTRNGTWSVEGNQLTVVVDGETIAMTYALSNNDKALTLTNSGISVTFTKQ